MGDKNKRSEGLIDKIINKIKNMRMKSKVEGCSRIIGYKKVRIKRNRNGNNKKMEMKEGKMVRIKIEIEEG